jgi:hypothetical protein
LEFRTPIVTVVVPQLSSIGHDPSWVVPAVQDHGHYGTLPVTNQRKKRIGDVKGALDLGTASAHSAHNLKLRRSVASGTQMTITSESIEGYHADADTL